MSQLRKEFVRRLKSGRAEFTNDVAILIANEPQTNSKIYMYIKETSLEML